MDKSFWGPSTWASIHFACAGYSPERQHSYTNFIYSLCQLLPCNACCQHLTQNLEKYPITHHHLRDSEGMLRWSYDLHNVVNAQNNKKSVGYNIVKDFYVNRCYPEIWGKHFWRMIHCFAASYDQKTKVYAKDSFKQFIASLPGVLPCEKARANLIYNLRILPLTESALKDNHTLFLWTYQLHDLFNRQFGKSSPPFEQVKSIYFNDKVCELCSKA